MAKRPAKQRDGAGATLNGGATTGYEADLWRMADTLRGSMDAASSCSARGSRNGSSSGRPPGSLPPTRCF